MGPPPLHLTSMRGSIPLHAAGSTFRSGWPAEARPTKNGKVHRLPKSNWSFEEGVGEDGGDGDGGVVASDGDVDVGQAVVVAAGLVERGRGLGIAGEG